MKKIDLYELNGHPRNVYRPLGYDACMEGFDPSVTTPIELRALEHLPSTEHSPLEFEFPLQMHSVFDWAGIGEKDILNCQPPEWIVISKRMLAALEALGPFEHRALPVRIWDALVKPEDDPRKPATRFNDEYMLLYLPNELKIFDYRQSEYDFIVIDERGASSLKESSNATEEELIELEREQYTVMVEKTVLTINEQALPALFRLRAEPNPIFVTAWAAEKLSGMGLSNLYLPYTTSDVYAQDDVPAAANS